MLNLGAPVLFCKESQALRKLSLPSSLPSLFPSFPPPNPREHSDRNYVGEVIAKHSTELTKKNDFNYHDTS